MAARARSRVDARDLFDHRAALRPPAASVLGRVTLRVLRGQALRKTRVLAQEDEVGAFLDVREAAFVRGDREHRGGGDPAPNRLRRGGEFAVRGLTDRAR